MPVVSKHHADPVPKIHHVELETTFLGVEHQLSTPDTRIHQYLGIKYASVPQRFRQSILFTEYPCITNATKFGPICPQLKAVRSIEETMLGLSEDIIPRQTLVQDEFECLNLNITCPAGLTPQSRLPVMIWIHGGHGSSWLYDGGALVRKSMATHKPVIVVSINFRIGLFGFAASNHLREDNKAVGDEGVGNYGLRDQRKAMEWLHHFIGGFGGDPNNITVFGAASGGADIVCHLISKENELQPLFQRAIVQSAIFDPIVPEVSSAGWHLNRIMAALRVTTIEELRLIEAEKLVIPGQTFRTVDDGFFLRKGWQEYLHSTHNGKEGHLKFHAVDHSHLHAVPRSHSKSRLALRSLSRGAVRSRSRSTQRPTTPLPPITPEHTFQHQPLIIGDCSCDSLLWSVPASLWTPSAVVRRLRAVCQSLNKSSSVLRAYDISPYTPDDEIVDRVLDLVNDTRVAYPTECITQSAKQERGGRGVWRYVFDQESPSRGVPHHAADLVYLFDTVPPPRGRLPRSNSPFCDDPIFNESLYGEDTHFDTDSDDTFSFQSDNDGEFGWMLPVVDEWTYSRVRDAMQERWIAFANGEVPWKEDKVFVFGPEGETGERSMSIFEGRRRRQVWKEALEPLGMHLVQKVGVELSRGPPVSGDKIHY
ncbi:hypothetical protein AMATHDRAFT_152199 [Amanita thiersii Skay4041]|uniref:Carboxylesterase type B domain-containing protein n=1 Tax=Amanita thiersii Skay4041 TaxID=703135 RepID=A0A2A9NDK3_9AGAR|nr:hypothetical protein AMATHDRAFT_152199 [Amanita thiersii Skay4041]